MPTTAATDAEQTLRASLSPQASLLTPDSPGYDAESVLPNHRFAYKPGWIVNAFTVSDVVATMSFVRTMGVPVSVRGGGMSPGGYASNTGGVMLSMAGFKKIDIDESAMTATVGAGVVLDELYAALEGKSITVPVGECMTVGVAGLTLGGGFSLLSRSLGLACDNLIAATVVLADGTIVQCDEQQSPDLLWALRGAGGGNFGVVTTLVLRAYEIPPLMPFAFVQWPLSEAADVLALALPMFGPDSPDALSAVFSLTAVQLAGPERVLQMLAIYNGTMDDAKCHLESFTRLGTPQQAAVNQQPYNGLVRKMSDARSDVHLYYKSGFVPPNSSSEILSTACDRFAQSPQQDDRIMNMVSIEICGGAINRRARGDTAFPHRNTAYLLSIIGTWTGGPNDTEPVEKHWADLLFARLQPNFTGGSYQNYADRELPLPLLAYYLDNLPQLQKLKAKYDPDNVLRFPQGITPP